MNFENTLWLYLTAVVVLLTTSIIAVGLRKREVLLGKFAATRLLDQLTEKASHTRTLIKATCVIIGLAAVCIALARPQYGIEWSERKARGLDIVFVLDSSKSMLATDMRPTRLERAKLAVIDLVERLESDRIGLVAFAGRAFLQTPPTLDYSAFRESLDSVGPTTISSGGSDLGNAINEAEKAFPKDNNFKVIILLTDGEDLGGNAIETAREAAKNGIKVYAIGMGTPAGEYLRIRNDAGQDEFIRDNSGQPVRSQLDEATLQQIAQLTGGTYSRLSSQSLHALYASVLATLPREEREAELQETAIERFQWAIAAALILLVLEILIRRRNNVRIHAALLALLLLPGFPQPAQAQETVEVEAPEMTIPDDARLAYNQAYEALNAGEFDKAEALYRSSIANSNDRHLERDALYNLAHIKNQLGRNAYAEGDLETALKQIEESEALFKSIQEIDPDDNSAVDDWVKVKRAREAIEALKEQQEPQDQENPEDNQEQGEDDSEQDPQDSESGDQSQEDQDSEPTDQESSDQQDSESQEGQDQPSEDGEQGQESDGQEGSESDSEQQQGEDGEPSEEEGQESTGNPAEDMAEDEQASGEQNSEEPSSAPQPGEGEEAGEGGQPAEGTLQVDGMTEADATALLDTLRRGEKLLPFAEQSGTRSKPREIRDW